MSQVRKGDAAGETCYGCIHQLYRGPNVVKDRARVSGAPVIPLREGDGTLSPGRYFCAKLKTVICGAEEMPRPLEEDCKEKR